MNRLTGADILASPGKYAEELNTLRDARAQSIRSAMDQVRAATARREAHLDAMGQVASLIAHNSELVSALRLAQRAILGQRTTGEAMVAIDAALSKAKP